MAGCLCHTAEDTIAEGFRPTLVREGVGDRVPDVTEWNLFDIGAKYGDVESRDCVGISRRHRVVHIKMMGLEKRLSLYRQKSF